jgi:signal transduction histidine kinase/DNA-binding response OmpR family regulator
MAPEPDFIPQRGELAALIRAKDWAQTPLGPADSWPASLRTVLRLMLNSRYAMWMGWGPDLVFLYNDAYAQQTLGAKHPWALGRPTREVWAEIWDVLETRILHVLETGEATWDEGLRLFLERNGYPEETYHTFSYSPAPGDAPDDSAGLFCVVIEETERVIGERRIALLRDLASSLGQTQTPEGVLAAVEQCLGADMRDIPFSLTYLFEDEGMIATRAAQTAFSEPHAAAPERVLLAEATLWPLRQVYESGVTQVVDFANVRDLPTGFWERAPARALVVPIPRQGQARPAGVFIAGLNPHRPLDEGLRSFVALFVGQVAAGLANAGAYEEARKRADALAELDRAKTAFFSNVSHEFRTPLTLMLGPTQDALASPERSLHGAELETVYRNEHRLLKLVNGLLDFARIEAGRTQASYEPVDLHQLTVDLTSTFRSAIERAGLELEVDSAPLPEPIYVDHDMWEKIVLNLLSNALKFTFKGKIRVALRWRGERADVIVSDTGVGIAASELPRLFERFHRVEGTRARTHEGSGIGLALVHELVRLHGGSLDVVSRVDAGTTFTISLPRGSSHLNPERIGAPRSLGSTPAATAYVEEALRWVPGADSPSSAASRTNGAQAGARILVADDNADMREYITRLLSQHWAVEAVSDGAQALRAARHSPPDLILSDVMMPHLDGFGLIRELRSEASTAGIPIILLSARAGEEATAEGLRAGADDYLVKPFSASGLLVRVEAQLSAARLRDTLRRNAEAESERLETIFQESPAAIGVLRGPEFVIELANPLLLSMWGKTDAVIGQPLLQGVPELRGQGFDDRLREVLTSGIPYRGKEALARVDANRDGVLQDHYFDFVYAPFPSADGALSGVFVHAYDVTDKVLARRSSEQLREAELRARQDAEAANRLKDEFLATMSHELRTPLNAILGWAALLQRGTDDRVALERGLATIERNARSQARLIEDVLDVSRIISGKLRIDVRRVDAISIARAAIDVVRPAAVARKVQLLVEHAPEEVLELVGDADRLQQVIWNLVSNAVKFTPSEGSVTVRVERRESAIQIVVRDTGSGIPREHLPFIFERFRQVDSSTTRQYGGLGLGLAIVRHLVELHGGSVTAESAGVGRGSTFTVQLPVLVSFGGEHGNCVSESSSLHEARFGLTSLSGIKLLIVDDDDDSRFVLECALERAGATVIGAESAALALKLLEEHSVDVLVSDIGMPGEDGFALMKSVRALSAQRGGSVPAIALTAYVRTEDVTRALEVGFQRHLPKPVDLEELARTITTLIEQARSANP